MEPRDAIRAFLSNYPLDRDDGRPDDVGQRLALAEARLQALALLLKKEPERLRQALDHLIYQTELSGPALAEARKFLGLLDRKTLAELLEGTEPEPVNWPPAHPGPLPNPIRLVGEGPSAAELVLADREDREWDPAVNLPENPFLRPPTDETALRRPRQKPGRGK